MPAEAAMIDKNLFATWIKRFLLEFIPGERSMARNTQHSYRDSIRLLLVFVAAAHHKKADALLVPDLSAEMLRTFLRHLEEKRKCSVSTRNQRLAAIHALARFIGERNPEFLSWCAEICAVPFKRSEKKPVGYLEKNEIDELLASPNRNTWIGRRDYCLLLFMYNSGARADEVARLIVGDLNLSKSSGGSCEFVRLNGKGNKTRLCPLWSSTAAEIKQLVNGRNDDARVFVNRKLKPITRFGVYEIVTRHVSHAAKRLPELRKRQISPHTIRHTTATHLLRAGVDINTIRAWLGHVSLDTTNIYAETDLSMKAKALHACELGNQAANKLWQGKPDLITFLGRL
jgi:site-specific recombinase XerD